MEVMSAVKVSQTASNGDAQSRVAHYKAKHKEAQRQGHMLSIQCAGLQEKVAAQEQQLLKLKKFKQSVQMGRRIKKDSCESEGCQCVFTCLEARPSHVNNETNALKFEQLSDRQSEESNNGSVETGRPNRPNQASPKTVTQIASAKILPEFQPYKSASNRYTRPEETKHYEDVEEIDFQKAFKTNLGASESLETPKLLGDRGLLESKQDRKNVQLSPYSVFDRKSPTNQGLLRQFNTSDNGSKNRYGKQQMLMDDFQENE